MEGQWARSYKYSARKPYPNSKAWFCCSYLFRQKAKGQSRKIINDLERQRVGKRKFEILTPLI